MKLFSRSALIAAVAAAGFLTAAVPTSACMFSKFAGSESGASSDGPAGLTAKTLDSNALGFALGGFGVIATLLTGGVMLYRKQRLSHLEALSAEAVETEFDLAEPIVEETLTATADELEPEKELVLTR